jgi:peptide/nickel transport system substrate-binding protein
VDAVRHPADALRSDAEVAAWFDAKTLDEERAAVRRLNKAALDHVVYAPLGWYLSHQAWRKNITGIVKGPMAFFWGVAPGRGSTR